MYVLYLFVYVYMLTYAYMCVCMYVSYIAFAGIAHKEFPPKTFRLSKMNLPTVFTALPGLWEALD